MVYYGRLSKGCDSCRRRKVKCDQAKPACQKCKVSGILCPGYRDLTQVMFRDETVRVKQKVLSVVRPVTVITSDDSPKSISTVDVDELDMMETSHLSTMMPTTHVKDVAAGFYFTNYTFVAPPLSTEYNEWLTEAYQNDRPSGILRSIIDAVGLAALANIYYAPQIATISKEKYCHALSSMRSALQDPVVAKEDTTFMTVILLGLYETVNLATWDSYHHWEAHVQGAIILLALRGSEQFSHERGGQLFMQIRSQILLACMQQNMAVPPALIDLTRSFEASTMRHNLRRRKLASAGSISEVSFRVVNLRAACRSGEIGDPKMIRDMSLAIDHDLLSWRTSVPTEWDYIESTPSDRSSTTYEGLCHTYPTIWIAEILNNWRTLRIIVNQMIMNNAEQLSGGHEPYEASALAAIKELSKELCASVPGFSDTPRKMSLIRPMYVVAISSVNAMTMRRFGIQQLRSIGATMGIRQASLLAETVSEHMEGRSDVLRSDLLLPLLPCG